MCKIFIWLEWKNSRTMFSLKQNKCGFSVCEFIITRYILHLQWKLVCFLWDSTLSNCHNDSVIVQSASLSHCRTRDLSAVCRDAGFTTRCLNCSKLCEVSEGRGVIWIQQKVRQCWKMTQEMRFTVAESGSVCEQNAETKGRKRVRQRDTVPYSCAWGADGLLSMSSLFSFSGLSSIQPLHRHSGWVSQQGYSVYVCVSVHAGLWVPPSRCNKLKMIQPMSLLTHGPLPKPSLWPVQRWSLD